MSRMQKNLGRKAAIGLMAALAVIPANAAQINTNWIGGAGNWNNAANWSAGIPNNGANTFNVFIDNGNAAASSVTLDIGPVIDNLTIDAGDSLTIPDNRTLSIVDNGALAGTINNAGTILLSTAGNPTQLGIGNGTVSLTGGGTLTMSNHPANRIVGGAGTDHFINVNNLIQGAGNIGANTFVLTNQASGVISANQSNVLNIDPNVTMTNAGLLRATGGGTLTLNSGTYANVGGTIDAQDASTVNLASGAVIEGGTLQSSGSGAIRGLSGSALDGAPNVVANTANFIVPDNNTVGLSGTISNTGTVSLQSVGNPSQLSLSGGDVTLSGAGTVTMGNIASNRITGGVTDRLINLNNTIQGAGNIGTDLIPITNEASGLIVANQSNTLVIDPNASMTNNGVLRAAGGTLTLNGAVYANLNGEVEALANSAVVLASGATIDGGTLQTVGTGVIVGLNGSMLDGAPNTVTNSGNFNVPDNHTTSLTGTISNSGLMTASSVGNPTGFSITGGDVTLIGGGTLSMSNISSNRITGSAGTDRLVNSGHTIQGSGNIGSNTIGILNQSLIIANQSNALTIDPAATMTNTGTLRATAGATLSLANGTYVNAGGIIEAQNLSAVNLNNGAVIDRGTFQTSGNGVIRGLNGSTLDGSAGPVNNTGAFDVPDNNTVGVLGSITNSGAITFSSLGNPCGFSLSGTVTLGGGGTLAMGNVTANRITGSVPTDVLSNGVNHTIEGSGNVGSNVISINNQGEIAATLSNGLVIDPFDAMTNTGVLRADGAALTLNPATYANTGGTIEALDGARVDLNGATIDGGTLQSAGSGFIRAINGPTLDGSVHPITSSGAFNIPDNHTATIKGSLVNTGQMSITTVGNPTRLSVGAGGLTLGGGGTITFSNHPANRIEGASAADVLTNQNNTIQGSGNIGVNFMGFVNQGLVNANVSNALTIDPATSMTNTGTLRASAGGVLALNPGTYNNVGGIIEAQNASRVDVGAATIAGGTLQTSGTGFFRSFGAVLDGTSNTILNAGHFNIPDNSSASIKGTINNTGNVSITTAGNPTTLIVNGNTTITGSGAVTMSNHPANRITGAAPTDRLFNAGNTISGSGNIGLNAMGLTNQAAGTIVATQSNPLTIDVADSESFINQGNLQANGGNLSVAAGPFTQTGAVRTFPGFSLSRTGDYTQTGGSTIVNGGLSASSGVAINGGTLGGTGTVSSPVTTATNGAVNPGDPAGIPTGTLTIASTYAPSATGALTIELAGVATGQADNLAVTGVATLDGTLNIVPIAGYTPSAGDKFVIMTYASHVGEFATINGQVISPTLSWFVAYANDRIRISARTGCGGSFACDTNCDGTVNQFDINAFVQAVATHAGCHACAGDANGDGTTNTFDIQQFLNCLN